MQMPLPSHLVRDVNDLLNSTFYVRGQSPNWWCAILVKVAREMKGSSKFIVSHMVSQDLLVAITKSVFYEQCY